MKILYISACCSSRKMQEIYDSSKVKPMYSIQKFHRLVMNGLVRNQVDVTALSAQPISSINNDKIFWKAESEMENGVEYMHIPFLNLPIFRQLILFFYSFFYTLFWSIRNRKEGRIICDVLNISICMGALYATKIAGAKSVAIVTDMPGLMNSNKQSLIGRTITKINKSYLTSFDYYIILTEQMNAIVNPKNRPYIVMEGLVDVDMQQAEHNEKKDGDIKTVIYAGGLYEKYGIKMMIEAFLRLEYTNIQLSLYGMGDMVDRIKEYEKQDARIKFYGAVPNDVVVEAELDAALLVNPRPTHEEFTKYSFPSKNMEYMVSGAPILTTRLPGMPSEYNDFVYLFNEETTEGYYEVMKNILGLSMDELMKKGKSGKAFVLREKNNVKQGERVKELLWNL